MTQPKILEAKEDSTSRYTATLQDEGGNPLGSGDLTTLTLTLTDEDGATINGRSGVSVLNANGGTLDVSGNFVMIYEPADNPVVKTARRQELHLARFDFTYGVGKAGHHEVQIRVENSSVP